MRTPTKLTPEVQTTIAKILRAGGTIELAASVAGVSEGTLCMRGWSEEAAQGARRPPKADPLDVLDELAPRWRGRPATRPA